MLIATDFDAADQELDEPAAFRERLFAVSLDEDPNRKIAFDREYIERATWDPWHEVSPLFFRRLQEALGLDDQQASDLSKAWVLTGPDEEGFWGRSA